MTIDELKDLPVKKKNYGESKLQQACVKWFRLQYPQYALLLFSIPNGGKRGILTATRMKKEGTVKGVADLFFAIPHSIYHGLFIEMKKSGGYQSPEQKLFQRAVQGERYQYIVCKSFEEFTLKVDDIIKSNETSQRQMRESAASSMELFRLLALKK